MERDLTPDWILKETLSLQRQAIEGYFNDKKGHTRKKDDGEITLTFLGCGTMGIAILGGIFEALSHEASKDHASLPGSSPLGTAALAPAKPCRTPTKFNACVRQPASAERIRKKLGRYPAYSSLKIHENENVVPTKEADVVLLCCEPHVVSDMLQTEGMREALTGKLLISIAAGITEQEISASLSSGASGAANCTIIRAMPNAAAAIRESMTVIATPKPPLPPSTTELVTWIFSSIGRVIYLPLSNMGACTALCGSGPAFVALMVESLAAGAIAMGVPREESYTMAAQMVRGTTALLLHGEHPALLRDKVSTPGGCTMTGLNVMEEGGVRGVIARAVREAAIKAGPSGEGRI